MPDAVDLTGQTALVTGGSRGLGRGFALAIANAGAKVAITGTSPAALDEAAALITDAGGTVLPITADAADEEATAEAVAAVEVSLGPVDLLVNNAGIIGPLTATEDADPAQWWRTLEVNLRGPYLYVRAVLPGMRNRRRGRIINLSSAAGVYAATYAGAYCASKAALSHWTNVLALELTDTGVAAFAYAPGLVRTGMTDYASNSPEVRLEMREYFTNRFAEGTDTPMEAAVEQLMFLASGKADALSGRHITVTDDRDALLGDLARIKERGLYVLGLRS